MDAEGFVSKIAGFADLEPSLQTDLLALYVELHAKGNTATVAKLSEMRSALRLRPHKSMAQYMSQCTKATKRRSAKFVKAPVGYNLERGYSSELQQKYLRRPTQAKLSRSLRQYLSSVSDGAIRSYCDETVRCFESDLFRSAVVMAWCVAYGVFRSWLFKNHVAALNTAMSSWKTPVSISRVEDFQELTEATVIDTARKLSLLSKEDHKNLKKLLDERNTFAHPSLRPISASKCEAFVESVLQEVLPRFV